MAFPLTRCAIEGKESQCLAFATRSGRAVKQTTDGRDKGSTTIALVRAGNQKNHSVPCAVRSD